MIMRYGRRLGGIVVNFHVVVFTTVMLLFLVPVVYCAIVIIDSANSISSIVGFATTTAVIIGAIYFYTRLRLDFKSDDDIDFYEFLNRYFDVQVGIAIMTFVQIAFWMYAPTNANHEPRVALLAAISAALIYFRGQITSRVRRLFDRRTEIQNADISDVLPFDDVP